MRKVVHSHVFYLCLLAVFILNTFIPGFSYAQETAPTATSSTSLFIDDKGEPFIRISETGKSDQLIKLSEARDSDVFEALNKFDFKSIPAQSIKQFGPEYIKFSSALMIVQMSMCFGGNSSIAGLSLISSPASPTCVDDFITHLVDWKGWVGFYFFMLGNRYTSTGLMKIATISLHHVGKTKSIPALRPKIAPFFGYLGMAGGSLASQVVHHFLSAPSWGQCIDLLSEEGLDSLPCKEAYTHFLSVEDFWDDFAAGTMSLITSSAAAAVTHKLLGQSSALLKNVPLLAQKGIRIVGGDSKAIDLVAKYGTRAIRGIRVVKNITVATGVPGVVVFVTTQVGQFVLFLAWDEVLKNPIARAYYDWDTGSSTREALNNITVAAKANKNLNWEKPFVKTSKTCLPKRFNSKTNQLESECTTTSVDPLTKALTDLSYGAHRFRKKVLQNPIEMAISGWSGKMMGILEKYKFTKTLIEHLTNEREKQLDYSMNLAESGVYILALWKNALTTELSQHPKVPKNVQPLLAQLEAALAISYAAIEPVPVEETPAQTNYFTADLVEKAAQIPMNSQRESSIKLALQKLKDYAKKLDADAATIPALGTECHLLPHLCLAKDTTLALDLNKSLSLVSETSHYDLAYAFSQIFGDELSSQASWELLCGSDAKIKFKNLKNNGKKASMSLPVLLKWSRADFDANCYDVSTLRDKFFLTHGSLTRPWIYEGRFYKTPLDLLASKNVNWLVAASNKDIKAWWTTEAFQPFSKFLFEMAKIYQGHLQEHLLSKIDDVTPEQLLHMSTPRMRGAALDHHIVSFNGAWERPSLAMSLMGQVHFMLDTIKYYGPKGANSRTIDDLKVAYAKYILGVKVVPNINSMEAVWATYQTQSKGPDIQSVINAQEEFDRNLRETVLSKEHMAAMLNLRKDVVRLKDELFNQMSYRPYDDLTGLEKAAMRLRATEPIVNEVDYVSISSDDQKLFATFILLNESLNNITMEIDKLYDKLGAKPFTGM